jgi:cell division transport system permease protein
MGGGGLMPVSAGYVAREATTNLWRNRLMTVAAVLTVAVSLALVGSALLLKQGATKATVTWQQGVNVIVWVQPTASQTQNAAIGTELGQNPLIKRCVTRSQAFDYSEAKTVLPVEEVNATQQSDYPSSFRCVLFNPSEAGAIKQQFIGKPGVRYVQFEAQQIRTMENVIHVLQWVFFAVAVILMLSAAVLILNTIRMAIFARRREVSVMKLVGATNWFIRLPFMAEGLIQGLLGSAVAVLVVLSLYWAIGLDTTRTVANTGSLAAQMSMGGWEVATTCILVAVIGVGVGVAGSAFAVRRFLDV